MVTVTVAEPTLKGVTVQEAVGLAWFTATTLGSFEVN